MSAIGHEAALMIGFDENVVRCGQYLFLSVQARSVR